MQGWYRAIYTLSIQRPQPHYTNLYWKNEEKKNTYKYLINFRVLF